MAEEQVFSHLKLVDVHAAAFRNIVSLQQSQDLFDDLSANPKDWVLAQQVEDEVKPPLYRSTNPMIHRPFEDAQWFNAIGWPFKHWQASRFSNGTFGVWYGSQSLETTVFETVYHWVNGLLRDASFTSAQSGSIVAERKVCTVQCDAALLDLRPQAKRHAGLMHKTDYSETQTIGARLHREGHPGVLTPSVRHSEGVNYAILNPDVLSSPRHHCYLSYRLRGETIVVEKQAGEVWLEIPAPT